MLTKSSFHLAVRVESSLLDTALLMPYLSDLYYLDQGLISRLFFNQQKTMAGHFELDLCLSALHTVLSEIAKRLAKVPTSCVFG